MSEEIFEKDLKQLYKVIKGKLKVLKLLGGEPLLYKNIEKFLKILSVEEIKQYFATERQLCKYCGYGKTKESWHVSKYEVSEWYKI